MPGGIWIPDTGLNLHSLERAHPIIQRGINLSTEDSYGMTTLISCWVSDMHTCMDLSSGGMLLQCLLAPTIYAAHRISRSFIPKRHYFCRTISHSARDYRDRTKSIVNTADTEYHWFLFRFEKFSRTYLLIIRLLICGRLRSCIAMSFLCLMNPFNTYGALIPPCQ